MIKVVVGRFDYDKDFEKALNKGLDSLAKDGCHVSNVDPFGGNMFMGAFIHYNEAVATTPVAEAPKPRVRKKIVQTKD